MKLMISLSALATIKSVDAQDYATAVTGLPTNTLAVMNNEPGFVKLKYSYRTGWQNPATVSEELTRQFGSPVEPTGLPGYKQWSLGQGRTIQIKSDPQAKVMWIILKDQAHRPRPAPSNIQREAPAVNRHVTYTATPGQGRHRHKGRG